MGKKILIIEDELDVREDISELLQLEGYQVFNAANGFEGIALAQEHLPDLIICDIMMPGMDGFEVLNHLQAEDMTKTIPFVFLTARATLNDLRQGMDLGADDYLTKPFSLEDLLVAVQTRLRKEEARQALSESKMDQLRSTLAYSLPHELRTPLVSILGYSELLMMDNDDTFVQNAARTISESGRRLHHLIENYLLYAQLEVLKTQPEKVMMIDGSAIDNPNLLIETQISAIAEQHERLSDLQLTLTSSGRLKITDENLSKIIQEITDNAFKFSKPGQSVTITSHLQQNRYVLRIADEGMGMQESHLQEIGAYKQFNRALHEQQGSGLGLTIAKLLIELYGGQLELTSKPHQGTIVVIALPIAS